MKTLDPRTPRFSLGQPVYVRGWDQQWSATVIAHEPRRTHGVLCHHYRVRTPYGNREYIISQLELSSQPILSRKG